MSDTVKISRESAKAVLSKLDMYERAAKINPRITVIGATQCGCMGPLPECRCAKRNRLIREFREGVKSE